ncbi:L-lactate permease [Kocuria soli]|uniref:L-lactate permease n=1 Tax=Kocuria soli TaxID=2485125 RepID=A0A3N3ZRL2_9MICC|nr:L-lactate permease [Kocuria soli]ROZ63957.1 L-lactate permease [Kocuria soli]
MWLQDYDPTGSVVFSALLAAVPIIAFLLGLTVFKLTGLKASLIALVLAVGLGTLVFGLPVAATGSAIVYGFLGGLWPIGWIVLMAVWLYRIAVRAGYFDVIRSSISSISEDQRLQVLLIAFCFGGFLEGAAGFGIPIAICGALLVNLGFRPLRAAGISLVANAAFGGYGAIGIPVIVGAQQGEVPLTDLSRMMVVVAQGIMVFIPLLLVAILDGRRGLRETGGLALVIGVLVSGLQSLFLWVAGPALADIIPPLVGMLAMALVLKYWSPRTIYREAHAPALEELRSERQPVTIARVAQAWSPFYILSAFILVWSVPAVAAFLGRATVAVPMPFLHQAVARTAPIVPETTPVLALWNWSILAASGTAILFAALFTVVVTPTITWKQAWEELAGSVRQLWAPIVMICLVMAVANVMNFAGMSSSMALALSAAGGVFPLLSPVIGWIGVFVTGSVVNNNTLFASLQAVTAQQIGTSQTLLVASNTAGGVMAKVISPQSIAIATAAVREPGKEADLTRQVLLYSIGLLAVLCVWVFVLSLVF